MKGVIATAAIALALGLPTIFTNWSRSGSGNSGSNRAIGTVTALLAMIAGGASVIWFAQGCQDNIYDDTHNQVSWKWGPAWVLMLVVTILQFINMVINLGSSAGLVILK
eukprot:gene30349-37550_t